MSDEQRNSSPCPDAVWTDMWRVDLFYNLANYHPVKESRSATYYKIFRTPSRIFHILRQIVAVFSSAKFHRQCLLNPMLPHTQNMPDTVWHIVDRAYLTVSPMVQKTLVTLYNVRKKLPPKLEAIKKVAKEFSEDPEQILPQAGALESAKTYREKKAKPFWSKIVTILRSLYRAYMDLKERYDALQQRFFRECMRNDDLHDRIDELTEQNKHLTAQNKQSTQALETLKQAFGKEKVEATLRSTNFKNRSERTAPANISYLKKDSNSFR